MAITALCPACRAAYQLPEEQDGKKVRCKKCYAVFLVVAASSPRTAVRAPVSAPPPQRSSAVAARPSAVRKVARREEDDEGDVEPRRKQGKSPLPWILGCGMVAAGLLLLLGGGGLVAYLVLRDKSPEVASTSPPAAQANEPPKIDPQPLKQPLDNPPAGRQPAPDQPVQGKPVATVDPPEDPEPKRPSRPADEERRDSAPANNGRLSGEARDRVKRGTVLLEVTMADGARASGTGFFGCKEAPNIILTNAHVVGMLSPESSRPKAIDVFVNSGEANEWKTTARVLGVDRSSDLAVLDIGKPPRNAPEPLTVKSAKDLRELDEVYVFGFPLGKRLGKEITIRPSSVSSLRKKGGVLDRVQVNGGMDPGNSGGPVVDNSGHVIGVAVSGIEGRQINFAIPGERVHTILDGRISGLAFHTPYFTDDNKLVVPAKVEMIDPRNLVREVGIDVWTGDQPKDPMSGRRPSATTQPAALPGDSGHVYYPLTYRAPEATADIALPPLPQGKVYWQQPRWVNARGETRWVSAGMLRLPTQPVYRKPASLVLRYPPNASRQLDLIIDAGFKVASDEDSDKARVRTVASFTETVTQASPSGSTLVLRYRGIPTRELIVDGRSRPSGLLERIKNALPLLTTTLRIDGSGNISQQFTNVNALARRVGPQQVEMIKDFHEIIQQGLDSVTVSFPAGEIKPLASWNVVRHLPIDTPGKFESGKLDVTFTYLGVRKREGRDEAVLHLEGRVRGKTDSVSGKATGVILVDLATGQTIQATSTVALQLDAVVSEPGEGEQKLRVIATIQTKMIRKI